MTLTATITSLFGWDGGILFFLSAFTALGAGIKIVDDAFDEDKIDHRIALALSPILAFLWLYTMILSSSAATVLLAIVLGVLLTKKIDNKAHLTGFALIIGGVLLLQIEFLPYLTAVLTVIALLDEKGNDYADNNSKIAERGMFGKAAYTFLFYRMGMKLGVLLAAIFGTLDWFIFPAFLGFDIGYHLVDEYGEEFIEIFR